MKYANDGDDRGAQVYSNLTEKASFRPKEVF